MRFTQAAVRLAVIGLAGAAIGLGAAPPAAAEAGTHCKPGALVAKAKKNGKTLSKAQAKKLCRKLAGAEGPGSPAPSSGNLLQNPLASLPLGG
ncbi:hypothetical protein [Nonomuraea typhae]|uniref:Uncharacterized protein n=1 Tax=Nonomuraea typhae TaxID=2603600 RepID=A0ABW7Z357_9ACTN